jgi:regulatory associated protein of mTOR
MFVDPSSVAPQKALEVIGSSLQKQYERWQPKARYKQSLDPTVEDVKKLCISLRRNAKEERVLFHYNGHGVPRPTQNGEIWVFNRTYTQYIPLSIYDLQTWMSSPSIYVYDCSNAGVIVNSFNTFAEQHETEQMTSQNVNRGSSPAGQQQQQQSSNQNAGSGASTSHQSYRNCIQLAACAADQILPMNPELPADLFTSCLTTPVKTALKWFSLKSTSKMVPHVNYDMIQNVPGVLHDRRTMLGELNWIFTAITDTIAWNTLPRELFQTLFRQDLLVASLFRNFLLADRILRSYDCTPVSSPALPHTYRHPMWSAWDLALDLALSQLPDVLMGKPYVNSPFFEEQLTAFQVWLEGNPEQVNPPEQLPIVLQVLLSQAHRIRALELLEKFLDIGPWAVNLALNVGIFPYVLKLLQSQAVELRPYLVCIWAKILAVDYVSLISFSNIIQRTTTIVIYGLH